MVVLHMPVLHINMMAVDGEKGRYVRVRGAAMVLE
jgi:hypothetical protein